MAQPHMVRRTEKLKQLKQMLEQKQIIYISSFFYSGKTVLLDQARENWHGAVLRYEPGIIDWLTFEQQVKTMQGDCLLLVDSLHLMTHDGSEEKLTALLTDLPQEKKVILAGRGQMPDSLHRLCASGSISVLDKDFVMMTEDEIEQLYLNEGIPLTPAETGYLKETLWGYVFALKIMLQMKQQNPNRPIRSLRENVLRELSRILMNDVIVTFPESQRILLYNLSPFERFSADMARLVTGRTDAPLLMQDISRKSYMLMENGSGEYFFVPFVRRTLYEAMQNLYSQDYIDSQYRRAALYYELQNQTSKAIEYYIRLQELEKIRELLIRDTQMRPANGDYTELRDAYAILPVEMVQASPELTKGMCMIESLRGRAEESERWYQELKRFIRETPARDFSRKTAEEAVAYLDICLAQRGSRNTLRMLLAAARLRMTDSKSWQGGFNVAGNSVSLLNGGLDFSRWVPHGWMLYKTMKAPIESALGQGGRGIGDIAIAECELESNLTGDYTLAMDKLYTGLRRMVDDVELRSAAIGIQSRIAAAQGNANAAMEMMAHLIETLPADSPPRLRQNLRVHSLWLGLLQGEFSEALAWFNDEAPDETREFNILDRYRYMMKLRIYIVKCQWKEAQMLFSLLRNYLEGYDRPYMRTQLHLLQAISLHRRGQDGWQEEMSQALETAKRYRLARVITDEGIAIIDMLNEMTLPAEKWEQGILKLTRVQAAHYPVYMKSIVNRPLFTDREYQVYSLLISGYRNAKIASILDISERTVKYYTGEIYRKLGVSTRAEALACAAELGDIR